MTTYEKENMRLQAELDAAKERYAVLAGDIDWDDKCNDRFCAFEERIIEELEPEIEALKETNAEQAARLVQAGIAIGAGTAAVRHLVDAISIEDTCREGSRLIHAFRDAVFTLGDTITPKDEGWHNEPRQTQTR